MKNVVVLDELSESALRPKELFEEYISILSDDIQKLLPDPSGFVEVACPGCASSGRASSFDKHGFKYRQCGTCGSFYVSARPTEKMLRRFYSQARAISFWKERFSRDTLKQRDEGIFEPRASWIVDACSEYLQKNASIIDWESKYPVLLQRLSKTGFFKTYWTVDPAIELPEGSRFALATSAGALCADALLMMEILERAFDPGAVISRAQGLLRDGGLLFVTTMTGSGFDLQVLREHSKNILPPTHLNLLSVEALSRLLESRGFEILELSTPGRLDVEIVIHALREDPSIKLPPVLADIVLRRDAGVQQAFQDFLQQARLSSHLRVVARKKPKVSQ